MFETIVSFLIEISIIFYILLRAGTSCYNTAGWYWVEESFFILKKFISIPDIHKSINIVT